MHLWNELWRIQNELHTHSHLDIEVVDLGVTNNKINVWAYKLIKNADYPYIVIIGCPHGNEPMGTWYCTYLLREILLSNSHLFDSLEINLLIIPILDMEIAQENKRWFTDTFNYKAFFEHSYLNPVYEQLEFAYSLSGGMSCEVLGRLHKELNKIDRKILLSCHQTPSIYGGYFYTNIFYSKFHRELEHLYTSKGIPLELLPQGCGVKILGNGVFGQFEKENLGEYHCTFYPNESSQTYYNDILHVPYLTMEIPFGYSNFLYNKELLDIKEFMPSISAIMESSSELLELLDSRYPILAGDQAIARKIFSNVHGYYWLKAFAKSDGLIQAAAESKPNHILRFHDYASMVRLLFYKGQFVGMLSRTEDTQICQKAHETLGVIIKFMDEMQTFMHIQWIEPKLGIQLIHRCIQTILRNKDDIYGST